MNEWTQFEIALRRETFHMLLIAVVAYAISFAITMWALYVVIKTAIKDGINESRLVDNWRTRVEAAKRRKHDGDTLPPMRAD
jgi:hypothetical protein